MTIGNKLSPIEVKAKLDKENICVVDVRGMDEFRSGHIPGAQCVPLDEIESGRTDLPRDQLLVLSCQSGRRSARAKELLLARGYTNLAEVEGGFSAWAGCGLPVTRTRKSIPVMRQVLITAGFLVFIGAVLGVFVHPGFMALPLFVGAGLMFAGITGWCGMAFLLERMPWNRNSSCSVA